MMRLSLFASLLALELFTLRANAQGADTPLPLKTHSTTKVTLDQNESAYYRVALPAGDFRVTLDTKKADGRGGNLRSSVSILNGDGGVTRNGLIDFNEIDVARRKVTSFNVKKPAAVGFKITNFDQKAVFWLTVAEKAEAAFIPLFGTVIPIPARMDESETCVLEQGMDAFYAMTLPKGEYQAIAEFGNSRKQSGNIQGYLARMDGDGGGQKELIGFNEIEVSFRKTTALTLKNDATILFRVHNTGDNSMDSMLRVTIVK